MFVTVLLLQNIKAADTCGWTARERYTAFLLNTGMERATASRSSEQPPSVSSAPERFRDFLSMRYCLKSHILTKQSLQLSSIVRVSCSCFFNKQTLPCFHTWVTTSFLIYLQVQKQEHWAYKQGGIVAIYSKIQNGNRPSCQDSGVSAIMCHKPKAETVTFKMFSNS